MSINNCIVCASVTMLLLCARCSDPTAELIAFHDLIADYTVEKVSGSEFLTAVSFKFNRKCKPSMIIINVLGPRWHSHIDLVSFPDPDPHAGKGLVTLILRNLLVVQGQQ